MNNLEDLKFLSVLYVEDEIETLELYAEFLSYYVQKVYKCQNSADSLELFEIHNPDIIITDIDMPVQNGVELVQTIRKSDKNVKIIMLTAHTDTKYMLPAVELNISRYLVKPISKSALLNALSKCAKEIKEGKETIVTLAKDLTFNIENKQLLFKDEDIKLQKKSAQILKYLVENKNKIVTYENISELLWGDELSSLNAIRCQIRSLRKKLPVDIVENVSGIGYKLTITQGDA
jgi:DNA-binding response OmpR family regulator